MRNTLPFPVPPPGAAHLAHQAGGPLAARQNAHLPVALVQAHLHPLLQLLARQQRIAASELNQAQLLLHEQHTEMGESPLASLKHILVSELKLINAETFQQAQAELLELPFESQLDHIIPAAEFEAQIPMQYAKQHSLFPLKLEGRMLQIAVENAWELHGVEDVARRFQASYQLVVSTRSAIFHLINRAYLHNENTAEQVIESLDDTSSADTLDWALEEPEDLLEANDEEPIKRLLNSLLHQATKGQVSDVHVEPASSEVVVRFRLDGVLRVAGAFPKAIHRTLLNRIKIMSKLDISQHGLPQDGRTLVIIAGKKVDVRVSTMPTVHGEKAVLRLLPQEQSQFHLRELGMPEGVREQLENLLHAPSGMFLVTGPTGSGKTTTLYAALNTLDRQSRNIMTIEDPVEYRIAGYVQTEVNPKTGLTFANALRSVLRQDPDVIMVGEMRDKETALIAIQASLTGHLVFSTVHTNSAAATLTRLVDMGVEPYLTSSTVRGVLAQRLVRRLCQNCKIPTQAPAAISALRQMGATFRKSYTGEGCGQCTDGLRGRLGVFEMLRMTRGVQEVFRHTTEANAITEAAVKDGMITMRQWSLKLVREGTITAEEALRLAQDEEQDFSE